MSQSFFVVIQFIERILKPQSQAYAVISGTY
jgi:hypothetical protein